MSDPPPANRLLEEFDGFLSRQPGIEPHGENEFKAMYAYDMLQRFLAERDVEEPMMQEWLTLLQVATDYMVAAEALISALQGKLGVSTREEGAREKAAAEIQRRVEAYVAAREAFGKYGRERQALLS